MFGRMLFVLFSAALIFSWSSALTPNEWRGGIAELLDNLTKCMNHGMLDQMADYFSDDAVLFFPKSPLTDKGGSAKAEENELEITPAVRSYIGGVDMIYSSPDVAVITGLTVRRLSNGSYVRARGLVLFVSKGDRIQIKMDIFNYV